MNDKQPTLDRSFIGKEYYSNPQHAQAEDMVKYARATNETNPRYFVKDLNELVPPPLYPVIFIEELLSQLVNDAEEMNLDILRVVHAEHEMWWRGRIRPGDSIISKTRIDSIEKRGSNELMDMHIECLRDDEVLVEMRYKLIMRGRSEIDRNRTPSTKQRVSHGKKIAEGSVHTTEDQGIRYGEASGDRNPIHISDEIAKSVGLPKAILQGLCTMALASQVIVNELLDGKPLRLKYMKVRFSKPVFMGDTLTTEIFEEDTSEEDLHSILFETKNPSGISVLTKGEAHFVD